MTAVARRRPAAALAGLLALAVVASGCTGSDEAVIEPPLALPSTTIPDTGPSTVPSSTTSTSPPDPGEVDAARPGSVFSSRELDPGDLAAVVREIRYRSRKVTGGPTVVSGIVAIPDGPPPAGGFPVLAWAHGTTGIADRCAPSRRGLAAVPQLREHLDAGYAVAATDYEGLGTPGVHPYLVAESEGRGVLDSVRAARASFGEDVVSSRVVVLGHSQGGHAALATAELAPTWAPELQVLGAAAIAPAADLELVIPALFDSTLGLALGVYVAAGWPAAHPELDPADLLSEAGLDLLHRASRTCVESLSTLVGDEEVEALRVRRPSEVETWAARIAENTIHPEDLHVPVLIAQGDRDTVVPRPLIDRLVGELCDAGVPLRYLSYGDADHGTIVGASMPAVHRWFAGLLEGGPPRSDCAGSR